MKKSIVLGILLAAAPASAGILDIGTISDFVYDTVKERGVIATLVPFKGDVSAAYAFATQVAEVEVDMETGVVEVLRLTAVHDIGRVINRLGAEGQVEGGVVMGLGYALCEELQVEGGRVRNPSFRDYKLITSPEVPPIDVCFVETGDPEGPYGAKGIGEAPAICTAPAVVNAVRHATGGRFVALPLTPERVFMELRG